MKWLLTISLFIICQLSFSQNSPSDTLTIPRLRIEYVLGKSEGVQVIAFENYSTKIYYNKYYKWGIDTIFAILDGKDTLNRFHDSELKDFEELLYELKTIPDYKLIFRIFEMYSDISMRETEIKKLTYTYKNLSIHLFGVFSEGFAIVKSNGKYGYINRDGYLVFDCIFENASGFKDGKALVKYQGRWYQLDYFGHLTAE